MTMAKRIYRESDEKTRILQSLRKQGALNPNYQKPRDEAVRQAISKKMKEYWRGIPSKNDIE